MFKDEVEWVNGSSGLGAKDSAEVEGVGEFVLCSPPLVKTRSSSRSEIEGGVCIGLPLSSDGS